jgi:hypothetical protein
MLVTTNLTYIYRFHMVNNSYSNEVLVNKMEQILINKKFKHEHSLTIFILYINEKHVYSLPNVI